MRKASLDDWLPLKGRWLRCSLIPMGVAAYTAYGWCVVTGQFQAHGHHHRGPSNTARAQINSLKAALDLYALDHGRIPTTGQGLGVLVKSPDHAAQGHAWKGPYLKDVTAVPADPWGNPYRYVNEEGDPSGFVIASYGSDGRPGGSGDAADVLSDPSYEGPY